MTWMRAARPSYRTASRDGDGRGPLRVVLLPERLPVAGEVPQSVVGPVDHDHQPRHVVEGDAALQLGAEADQRVMNAGDVAAVRDVGRSFAHRWAMRVWSRTRACAPWWRNWAVRVRRMVVLPPSVPLQTRMCGAVSMSMSTAMARQSVLMPISAAEAAAPEAARAGRGR